MRKNLAVCLFALLSFICLFGCDSDKTVSVLGEWELQNISDVEKGVIAIGDNQKDFENSDLKKYDMSINFKESEIFTLETEKGAYIGSYVKDNEKSTGETDVFYLEFEDGTRIETICGTTYYNDQTKEPTLQMMVYEQKKIIAFVKQAS